MFSRTIAAVIGLGAVVATTSAQADTFIYSYPFGPFSALEAPAISPPNTPSFDRMVEMCEAFGIDCSVPDAADAHPFGSSPEALADAQKRYELCLEEVEELAGNDATIHDLPHFPRLSAPLGWHGTDLSDLARDLEDLAEEMEERFGARPSPFHPVPHTLFGWQAPHGWQPHTRNPFDLGHATPVLPHHYNVPRGAFPRGHFPRGPIFPWPSL